MRFLRTVVAVAVKDLRLEARTRDLVPAMLVFSFTVIVVFNFTFEPGLQNREAFAPGVLLVAFTFAGMLGLSRSFALELEQSAIQGLLLAPVDRGAVYLGKMLSNFILLIVVLAASLIALGVLFNIDIFGRLPQMAVILGLAALGFVAVGTLYAAMATNIRLREILLPILFFPVYIPVIIAAMEALEGVLQGQELHQVGNWIQLLAAYDAVFLIVGILTFEYVVGE